MQIFSRDMASKAWLHAANASNQRADLTAELVFFVVVLAITIWVAI